MRIPSSIALFGCALALLLGAPTLRAQAAQTVQSEVPTQLVPLGSEVGVRTILPTLLPIKGRQFSANVAIANKQTLADGTILITSRTGKIARDGAGRTYNEITFVRDPSQNPSSVTSIRIDDSVNRVHMILNPQTRVARRFTRSVPADGATIHTTNSFETGGTLSTPQLRPIPARSHPAVDKEDLGTESIDGVTVQHYRDTQTIAAGEIGNDRDIIITSEFWYSRELRLNLKAVRHDPRYGEETLTLSEVERSEPAEALFEIPADYTVTDEQIGVGMAARSSTASRSAVADPATKPR